MTRDDTEIVSALRARLADQVGKDRFELWFGSTVSFQLDGGAVIVSVRHQFSLDEIRRRFLAELQAACRYVAGRDLEIRFRIDPSRTDHPPSKHGSGETAASTVSKPTAKSIPTDSIHQKNSAPRRQFESLQSFVVGDANRVAFSAATTTARQLGAVTPLFIYGPTGCGKTHLLEGIWSSVRRSSPSGRVVMLSAEQFTTYFLDALRGSGLPNFRRRYRGLDLLLIDDIQFFAGKRATLVEVQHTIDSFLRDGRQLVLAADRPPIELSHLGAELVTRISGGLVCSIQPADKATRLEIVRRWCKRRKYSLPRQVVDYVATQLNGDARQLSGALNRLHATGLALECPITMDLAETALADIVRSVKPTIRIADVERAVCDVFGLQPKELQSSRRSSSISHPRMLAMWLARKYTRAAFSEIGQYFGRRSHATVISAQKKVSLWMDSGKCIRMAHGDSRIEDAIRRVEALLRTG